MIKVWGNGYQNGQPVIHASANSAGDPLRRIRPVCGQRNRRAYYTPVSDATIEVNCQKCLTA